MGEYTSRTQHLDDVLEMVSGDLTDEPDVRALFDDVIITIDGYEDDYGTDPDYVGSELQRSVRAFRKRASNPVWRTEVGPDGNTITVGPVYPEDEAGYAQRKAEREAQGRSA